MKNTVKERILEFLKAESISQKKFEAAIGASNGYINNLKTAPSATILQKIFGAYPDINEQWLLTGEGEMLKSGAVVGGNGIAVSGNNVKTGSVSVVGGEAAALREKVKMMQALLEEKDKLLEEKERLIKVLMERG